MLRGEEDERAEGPRDHQGDEPYQDRVLPGLGQVEQEVVAARNGDVFQLDPRVRALHGDRGRGIRHDREEPCLVPVGVEPAPVGIDLVPVGGDPAPVGIDLVPVGIDLVPVEIEPTPDGE